MRNIYQVKLQEELYDVKDGKNLNYRHGSQFADNVIAESEEQALSFVRGRHTGEGVRPLKASAHLLLTDLDSVLDSTQDAADETKEASGETTQASGETNAPAGASSGAPVVPISTQTGSSPQSTYSQPQTAQQQPQSAQDQPQSAPQQQGQQNTNESPSASD